MIMKGNDAGTLTDSQFVALRQARAITTIELCADIDGGWVIRVNQGPYLRSQREVRRRFASLDTAARYLKSKGVTSVTVQLGVSERS